MIGESPFNSSLSDEESRKIDYDSTSKTSSLSSSRSATNILKTFGSNAYVSDDDTTSRSTIGLNLEIALEIEPEDMRADVQSVFLP